NLLLQLAPPNLSALHFNVNEGVELFTQDLRQMPCSLGIVFPSIANENIGHNSPCHTTASARNASWRGLNAEMPRRHDGYTLCTECGKMKEGEFANQFWRDS